MVETGSRKMNRTSFEDVQELIRSNKAMRAAVTRLLVEEFGSELTKHLEIVPRAAKSTKKK